MLQRRTKNGFWEIRVMRAGEKFYENTGETDKQAAQKRHDRFVGQLDERLANEKWGTVKAEPKIVPTLGQFIDTFLVYVRAGGSAKKKLAERTKVFYAYHAERLRANPELASAPLDQKNGKWVTMIDNHSHVQQNAKHKVSKKGRGFSEHTLRDDQIVLKRILRYAFATEVITVEPSIKIASSISDREVKHTPHIVTPAEEEAYLKVCKPQHRDFVALLLDTALRPEEAHRLTPGNLREGMVVIDMGKTDSAPRSIPATDRVIEIFGRAGAEWLFPAPTASGHVEASSFRKAHKAALKASGVPKFVLYDIRRTTLRRWSKKGSIFNLKELAGHKSIATTNIYVKGDDQGKRDMVLGTEAKEETPKRKAPKRARKNEKSPEAIMLG